MLLERTARAGWLIERKYYTSLVLRSPGILISLPLRLTQGEELASSIDEKGRPGFGSQPVSLPPGTFNTGLAQI